MTMYVSNLILHVLIPRIDKKKNDKIFLQILMLKKLNVSY